MRPRLFTTLVLCATGAYLFAAPADSGQSSSNEVVLAEVNGAKVTLADLEQKHPGALFQARTNFYESERKVIESIADDYLLEQQAKKEGITVPELLERHVTSTLPKDPSEEALRVYYEGVDTTEPYETVRGKILDALRERRMAKAKSAYLQSLRKEMPVIIRLAPPRAPISMKDVPVRGAANAHLTVLEFADYQCPVCQQVQPVLAKIEAEFKGKIEFAYKDFPINVHPQAPKAAEAAHCAGAQGKYWEFHDLMFARKVLDIPSLKEYAQELKLDTTAFDSCLDSGRMEPVVKAQNDEAMELGLPGTPTIFVNGRYVSGNITYDRLRAVITEELSATGVGMPVPAIAASRKGVN